METVAIEYTDRENSFIVVKKIVEPYGPGSSDVISVGCTLKGNVEDPTWRVHIPIDLADSVIEALKGAKIEK